MRDTKHNLLRPTETELRLLRPLWSARRLSARELHDAACKHTKWSYSATRKTLERMVTKGFVHIEVVHGLNTYVATQSKLETLARLITGFAYNVLESSVIPVAAFSHSKLVSDDEVEELEALIRKLAGEKPLTSLKGGASS